MFTSFSNRARAAGLLGAGLLSATALSGCDASGAPAGPATPSATTPRTEVFGTRLALTYDGGVMVIDRDSMGPVDDLPLPGFNRLNPAGDGRHVLVSTGEGFRVLDTGVEVVAHGDHAHYYGTDPMLTGVNYPAPEPGHVVRHAGQVALFSDGAGTVDLVRPADVARGPQGPADYTAATPHHGVAVPLEDDRLLVTVGTPDARTGAIVVDSAGTELARNESCPGVHGEATARNGAVLVGCTDGVLLWRDGAFTKIGSPDAYGRIGNQAGSEHSDVILGDYKTDEDAELEEPTRVSLVDTDSRRLRLVELGAAYSFRSLGRGPDGEALVLTNDGRLQILDPDRGKITRSVQVTAAWREPVVWQQPRPTLHVDGKIAFVTEPSTSELHAVDLTSGRVVATVELPHVPNEVTGVS